MADGRVLVVGGVLGVGDNGNLETFADSAEAFTP